MSERKFSPIKPPIFLATEQALAASAVRPFPRTKTQSLLSKDERFFGDEQESTPADPWTEYGNLMATVIGDEVTQGGFLENHQEVDVDVVSGESALSIYLREINKHPLLTPEEEVSLAQTRQQGFAARQTLTDPSITLTREERESLQPLAKASLAAERKMIESNLRLVVSVAKKYHRTYGMELVDLIQEGNIGLMRAVEMYDSEKGYRLSSYAYWWIRQGVTRSIADQSRVIRLPVHVGEGLSYANRKAWEFHNTNGRAASRAELREVMIQEGRYTEQAIDNLFETISSGVLNPASIHKPIGHDKNGDFTLEDVIPTTQGVADTVIAESSEEQLLKAVGKVLSPDDANIIHQRFMAWKSLEKIGKSMNLTRERIRQRQNAALYALSQAPSIKVLVDQPMIPPATEGRIPILEQHPLGLSLETTAQIISLARQTPKAWNNLPTDMKVTLRMLLLTNDPEMTINQISAAFTKDPWQVRGSITLGLVNLWNRLRNKHGEPPTISKANETLKMVEQTLQLVKQGYSNRAIAQSLGTNQINISLFKEGLYQLGLLPQK